MHSSNLNLKYQLLTRCTLWRSLVYGFQFCPKVHLMNGNYDLICDITSNSITTTWKSSSFLQPYQQVNLNAFSLSKFREILQPYHHTSSTLFVTFVLVYAGSPSCNYQASGRPIISTLYRPYTGLRDVPRKKAYISLKV